jgi:hypothetical protein
MTFDEFRDSRTAGQEKSPSSPFLLSKEDPSVLFNPPWMDGETMALEAVGAACPHGRVPYGREMTPQAIAVGDLLRPSADMAMPAE